MDFSSLLSGSLCLCSGNALGSRHLDGATIHAWLVLGLTTGLDLLHELRVTVGHDLEEIGLDIGT